jgi:V/A-type H+-transporting ATPase subunit I
MIEPMAKAFVGVRQEQRHELLTALGALGALHLVPASAENGRDEGELADALARTRQALKVLDEAAPAGAAPPGTVADIVAETLELQKTEQDLRSRLVSLEREARDAAAWGRVTKARIEELARHGVPLRVVTVTDDDVAALPGRVIPVRSLGKKRSLVILVGDVEAPLPRRSAVVTPPERDLPGIEAEIAEARTALASVPVRLARLSRRSADLSNEVVLLEDRLSLSRARRSGLDGGSLYGVQGWLPLARAGSLAAELEKAGIRAAVRVRPAAPGEHPPTLVRYPRLLRPIRSLFDLLGVRPGYDEIDPTAFFMVAVPLFAGMLIADAGYGMVFLSASLYARRRLRDKIGTDAIDLITGFGATALAWGAISGSWFGVTPGKMIGAGGWIAGLGGTLYHLQLIRGSDVQTRDTLIKVCFLLGSVHLILAHLRRVVALAPDMSALADLGWCGVLAAMLGVIWNLFFREAPLPGPLTHGLLGAGAVGFALVAFFGAPDPNPLVRVAKGFGGGLFPLIGAFGDTLSYIRLAAVGLASFYLAVAIDTLAGQAAAAGTWLAGLPILLVGHSLNMTLSLVAILAHGVRLNLLEFSNHSGLQWAGYPYRPFAARTVKEH